MRRRLLRAFLAVIVVAVAVLGIPLGIIASYLAREQAVRSLDREADAIGFATTEQAEQDAPIPASAVVAASRPGRYVTVRDAAGRTTTVGTRPEGRTIRAEVKTASGGRITIVASAEEADEQAVRAWSIVAGLAVVGIGAAVLWANREAKRLGRPLDDLAEASRHLGSGGLAPMLHPVGIAELDAVGEALEVSGERIAELVRREREFSSNASHQLRTPLTALRVRLEEAAMGEPDEMAPALVDAFAEVDRLDATITELLALARSAPNADVEHASTSALFAVAERRWTTMLGRMGRQLDGHVPAEAAGAEVPARPVTEVLDVLIENALRHGTGTVHLAARRSATHLVLAVSDDGPGIPPELRDDLFTRHVSGGDGTGVGLALARTLAQSIGGRLELTDPGRAAFELYVPVPAAGP